ARQLASGAWGITVATIGQLRAYRAFGFPRLLLANELVDETGIAWLAGELAADPGFSAYCYVDSTDGVAILDQVLAARPAGRRLPVLVEIGLGRTGCRTDEQALAVAKAAAATGTLAVAGVAGYEGSLPGGPTAQTLATATSFCRRLADLAGGVTGAPVFRPALELWAQVVSRPEPGLALLGAGRRDAGFDAGLPVPLRVRRRDGGADGLAGAEVTGLNDQHAYLRLDHDTGLT